MIRWSPISRVFSMEAEGMTRACPIAPLISRNTRPTQNQASTSCRTLSRRVGVFVRGRSWSVFTFHRHRGALRRLATRRTFADLQLHQVGRIASGVAGGAEVALAVADGLAQAGERDVAERVGAEEPADLLRGVGGCDQLLAGRG